jgi:hypothetical protein
LLHILHIDGTQKISVLGSDDYSTNSGGVRKNEVEERMKKN